MEILEADALAVQLVQVGRFKNGITVGLEISITLVIRKQDDNIGSVGGNRRYGKQEGIQGAQ